MRRPSGRKRWWLVGALTALALLGVGLPVINAALDRQPPNVFLYNFDDLRDEVAGGIDPLAYLPKTARWLADGTRFATTYVAEPSCCPSRSSLFTGRFPHNNGVRLQGDGAKFDAEGSMACYLQEAGYSTYQVGKFLTTWPRDKVPPCFSHSTVMWGGYEDVGIKTDGVAGVAPGYSTSFLGQRGREYIDDALEQGKPFLLYQAPHAPHTSDVTAPGQGRKELAVPEERYAGAEVESCTAPPEVDRSDKPPYVRWVTKTPEQSRELCESQLRSLRSADDEIDATLSLLRERGVLDDTLVIVTSDNGYLWGEHGRHAKFVPYEPSVRVPLLVRWPERVPAGVDAGRQVSYLDILPTVLAAAGVPPDPDRPLDGESLLSPSKRDTVYAEYWLDSANGSMPTWRMARTPAAKYVQIYDEAGQVTFREYYDLAVDPTEELNLLGDDDPANDPPSDVVADFAAKLAAFGTCAGVDCLR